MNNMDSGQNRRLQPGGERIADRGSETFVVNMARAAGQNQMFRAALWTGAHLQVTLMSIPAGGEIGLEAHPNLDQLLYVQEGRGMVKMGERKDQLRFQRDVFGGHAVFVPAGKWHNLVNTGNGPIKLFSVYAPPQHPKGTVHRTKAEADAAEHRH